MLDCKTWMLCNLSDMFAWAYGIQKLKRVQIPKKNLKKKKRIIIIPPTPEKAFGHNQLPIPNRKLENKRRKIQISLKLNPKYIPKNYFLSCMDYDWPVIS